MHKDFDIIGWLVHEIELYYPGTKRGEKAKRQLDERLEMLRI
jgi:hypothetical protein